MFKRREFIRALAMIPAAALVPFAAAKSAVAPIFHTGGVVNRAAVVPFLGEMPFIEFAPPIALEDAVTFSAVAACRIKPPVDRVYELPLDDEQSTVRWVHAESELWICHGADGCLWMPLQDSECKRRRMQK